MGDDDSAADSGAVYVFVRNGSAWTQQAYLKASNTDADDRFGRGVGISGNSLVVGAVDEASAADGVGGDQSNNDAPGAGAAYVFIRNAGTWTQQAYLKPTHSGAGDSFGYRVVIDGDTVAVSAPFEASGTQADGSDDSEPEAGAVYVFARSSGVWTQQAYLKAIAPVQYDWFGIGVALLGDRVLIGAAHENGAGTGFRSDDNSDALPVSGAVYVFERDVTQWTYIAYAKAANAGSGDQFGYAVDLFDDVMLVGARTERSSNDDPGDDGAPAAGAVYVLR